MAYTFQYPHTSPYMKPTVTVCIVSSLYPDYIYLYILIYLYYVYIARRALQASFQLPLAGAEAHGGRRGAPRGRRGDGDARAAAAELISPREGLPHIDRYKDLHLKL